MGIEAFGKSDEYKKPVGGWIYTIVVDYGKPYDIKVDTEEQLKKELKHLNEMYKSGEYPFFDIWIYDMKGKEVTSEILKKYLWDDVSKSLMGKRVTIKLSKDDDEYARFNNKSGIVVGREHRFYSVSMEYLGTFLFTVGELQLA